MNQMWRLVAAGLTALLAGAVQADGGPGKLQLERFLNDVTTLQANFAQVQMDADGAVLAESSGQLWISRPNRFRWQYATPYEQLILCDGVSIWSYDPDLEQATRRPADDALNGTPAALLSQQADALEGFNVHSTRDDNGEPGVELTPTSADSDFASIRLWFDNGIPTRLHFSDQLGGSTRIVLRDVRTGQKIKDSQFEFRPPKGTEVIDSAPGGS